MGQDFSGRQAKEVIFVGALVAFLCIALSFFFVTAVSLNATETQEMPEEIVINNKVYETDRKGSVWFSHSDHAENYVDTCDGCHHEYKDGENVWEEGQFVKKCFTCHDPSKSERSVKKLNIAYHKNCKGCHKKLAKQGGTDAPYRQCTDCHEKR
jgi:hypothetical protein